MAKSVTAKYLDATDAALHDLRFDESAFAMSLVRSPLTLQKNFYRLAIMYIEILSQYADSGICPFGMKDHARAAQEMMKIIDEYFPRAEVDGFTFDGTEFEQI